MPAVSSDMPRIPASRAFPLIHAHLHHPRPSRDAAPLPRQPRYLHPWLQSMETLDQMLYADATEFDERIEPESVRPCPEDREGWPMDLYEMLSVNGVGYVSKMGLVIDLDGVGCRRTSSAAYQPVVVALLLLKMKVKGCQAELVIGRTGELRVAYAVFQGDRSILDSNDTMARQSVLAPCVACGYVMMIC
jgi:hypothetical protein